MFLRYLILFLSGFLVSAVIAYAGNKAVPKGYLLVQGVHTSYKSQYGAIYSRRQADSVFGLLKGRVNGVEFEILGYSDIAVDNHRVIAEVAKNYGIDLWASSWRIIRGDLPTLGISWETIKANCQARRMDSLGHILPAYFRKKGKDSCHVETDDPVFDILNPEAMDTFITLWESRYWDKMKISDGITLLNGFFFNEDHIKYLECYPDHDERWDYWNFTVYSDAVLEQWREYCIENNVLDQYNNVVDKFPVHKIEMVPNGIVDGEQFTAYYPGYNVPKKIYTGQRFVDLPRAEGVWVHWFDFIGELFVNNWIGRLAKAANEANKNNPDWYGVVYFGNFFKSLPYECIEDSLLTLPEVHRWGAWGRQRGLDLKKLAGNDNIDIVVCETYPPVVGGNLEGFAKEFKRIIDEQNKVFGLMLHRDDDWALELQEEKDRWEVINKIQPQMICRYPCERMIEGWEDSLYSEEMERFFREKLEDYREP